MSAAPDIRPHSVDSANEAMIRLLEENELIIRGLRKQNERLAAEKLNAELEASLEVAKAKFAAAQVGEAHRRIKELDDNLNDLRNWITGNCVQRDEFDALKREHYALSYRVPV